MRPVAEQTVLVTGSSDGHGKRVAQELAARGATLLVHGRDRRKAEAAAEEIGSDRVLVADLASLDAVHALADEIDELDTLVNNAGVIVPERRESADGYELTFAVNYLSHFLLTQLLLPKLREPGRIVNVSSIGQAPLDFDDLMLERDYNAYLAYAHSKLAQVMFTIELAERLDGRDITVNALHPATLMNTKMVTGGGVRPRSSVEEGVEATLRLVAAPDLDGVTGRFFDGTRESAADGQAYDADARRRLWEVSERLTGIASSRWIVDGMNVIGSRPTGWWRDRRAAMRELVAALRGLGEPVTVVFDGEPFDLSDEVVDVRFASRRARGAADDEIVVLVAEEAEPSRVVTSDVELAERVRALGAEVVGAGAFRARLKGR